MAQGCCIGASLPAVIGVFSTLTVSVTLVSPVSFNTGAMCMAAVAFSLRLTNPVRPPTASMRASGREPDVSSRLRNSDGAPAAAAAVVATASSCDVGPSRRPDTATAAAERGVTAAAVICGMPTAAASACSADVMFSPGCRLSLGPSNTRWDRHGNCAKEHDQQRERAAGTVARVIECSCRPSGGAVFAICCVLRANN